MRKLEDRKIVHQDVCPDCKHCYIGEHDDPNGPRKWYYFCLLDLSDEERQYVEDAIWDRGGTVNYYSGEPFPQRLLQIMKVESEFITDSPRLVGEATRCQFFE